MSLLIHCMFVHSYSLFYLFQKNQTSKEFCADYFFYRISKNLCIPFYHKASIRIRVDSSNQEDMENKKLCNHT